MRVISQNGKYDVPYENFVFVSEQNMIYAVSIAGSGTKQWLMAEYTGPGKRRKLWKCYTKSIPALCQVW